MRGSFIIFVISLSALVFVEGLSAIKCNQSCTKIYKPLCAVLRRGSRTTICTFANECILDSIKCRQKQAWEILDADKRCKRDSCNCRDLLR